MGRRIYIFLLLLLLPRIAAMAQKPFAEGTIIYVVKLRSADQKELTGRYTFVIKGGEIRKELKLNNGFQDVVLLNCNTGKVYSLQNRNGKKFAIQSDMDELLRKQQKFSNYTMKNEIANTTKIAGYASYKGNVNYTDGSNSDIVYTKDWCPAQAVTFERFPAAKFLPVSFSYRDEDSVEMEFEIEKIEPGPIENAVFRIPPDYKMISYAEYKQLSK